MLLDLYEPLGLYEFSAIVISILILYYGYSIVHSCFLSPLANVPNAHWSSPVSPCWILWKRYRYQELSAVVKATENFGPIVRLGPNDLCIGAYENGVRTIYGGSFEKPGYFDFYRYYGRINAFSSLVKSDHSLRRRRSSALYSKSTLYRSQHLLSLSEETLLGKLAPKLQSYAATAQSVEFMEGLIYPLCLDYLNAFIFGYSSGSDFMNDTIGMKTWLEHYHGRNCQEAFWPQEMPVLTKWLEQIGVNMVPTSQSMSKQYLEDWMMGLCDKAEAVVSGSKGSSEVDPRDVPVVYQQVRDTVNYDLKGSDSETKKLEIASELYDHMSASREVLGLVLGYSVYYVSKHPQVQSRLRNELRMAGIAVSGTRLPSPQTLESLPYLTAVINESLRMRPNSTPLPRITPHDRTVSILGYNIPPNTRVNSFQWLIHRGKKDWCSPDSFMPERWLQDERKAELGTLWPFGSGSRMCVGLHLADYIMRNVLKVIFSSFETVVVNDESVGTADPGSLEDRFTIRFKALESSTS